MKLISLVLIFSILISSFSCYSTIFFSDHDKMRAILNDQEEVFIVKKDSTEYYLDEASYNFTNDSLYGDSQRIDYIKQAFHNYSKKNEPDQVIFAYDDIAHLKTEEFNWVNTTIFIGTSALVISGHVLYGISENLFFGWGN